MTDEELNKTLIARLRKVDEYEPLGHDGWEAADRIEQLVATNEALVKARREDALELLAALGQAQEAYEAQLKAEAHAERLEAALLWCSGSADFHEGGVARKGWLKVCAPLLRGDDHE